MWKNDTPGQFRKVNGALRWKCNRLPGLPTGLTGEGRGDRAIPGRHTASQPGRIRSPIHGSIRKCLHSTGRADGRNDGQWKRRYTARTNGSKTNPANNSGRSDGQPRLRRPSPLSAARCSPQASEFARPEKTLATQAVFVGGGGVVWGRQSQTDRRRSRSHHSARQRDRTGDRGQALRRRPATRPNVRTRTRRRDEILSRGLRKGVMGRRSSQSFSASDSPGASRALGENGYHSIVAARDMEGRARGLHPQQAIRDIQNSGRNCLADLMSALKIFAWLEPPGRIRDSADTGFGEIDIERRMSSWAAGISILGVL